MKNKVIATTSNNNPVVDELIDIHIGIVGGLLTHSIPMSYPLIDSKGGNDRRHKQTRTAILPKKKIGLY